jgi:hypothetical protein
LAQSTHAVSPGAGEQLPPPVVEPDIPPVDIDDPLVIADPLVVSPLDIDVPLDIPEPLVIDAPPIPDPPAPPIPFDPVVSTPLAVEPLDADAPPEANWTTSLPQPPPSKIAVETTSADKPQPIAYAFMSPPAGRASGQ